MSRKHYIAVADVMRRAKEHGAHTLAESIMHREISESLAYIFANDNERFDRQRFLTACGVER